MKVCTLGKRHKWTFIKNVITSTHGIRTTSISSRGLYSCACGARKHGEPDIDFRQEGAAP